jgi:hypothetical protein
VAAERRVGLCRSSTCPNPAAMMPAQAKAKQRCQWGSDFSGCPTAARKRTFSRWLAESLSWYGRGGKHPVLDRPLTHVVLPEEVMEALQISNRRLLGIRLHTDVQDAPRIRSCQKHPDQQELPVLRSRLRSVQGPVRPAMQS